MCCCCNNPATATGVVGGIVINFAFAGLIAFGAATFWPLGFIISFIYTGLLFYLSMYIRKKYKETIEGAAVVADILVMVAVFAFAVTTLFLPVNLLGCGTPNIDSNVLLEYNNAPVPTSLQTWAASDFYASTNTASSFAQLNTSELIFSGNNGIRKQWTKTLMKTSSCSSSRSSNAPVEVDPSLEDPQQFVTVTASTVCFIARQRKSVDNYPTSELFCTNGDTVQSFIGSGTAKYSNPTSIKTYEGLIYLKAESVGISNPKNGWIYLADPKTSSITRIPPRSSPSSSATTEAVNTTLSIDTCDQVAATFVTSLAVLFITSIPTFLLAVAIAIKFQISSMAVPLFLFTSTAVVNIYIIIDPAIPEMSNLLKWWTTLFSSLWLIVALVLFLTNRVLTSKYSAAWYMNVGGLIYFGAIHAQLLIPVEDDAWRWVLYQFLLVIPLALYAVTCDKTLFLLLSSGGIIIDVWRLSTFITNLTTNTTAQILIRFCILAGTGVGIVYGGILYQQNASMLQKKVVMWSQNYLICRKDEVGDGNKVGVEMAHLDDVKGSDVEKPAVASM